MKFQQKAGDGSDSEIIRGHTDFFFFILLSKVVLDAYLNMNPNGGLINYKICKKNRSAAQIAATSIFEYFKRTYIKLEIEKDIIKKMLRYKRGNNQEIPIYHYQGHRQSSLLKQVNQPVNVAEKKQKPTATASQKKD